MHARYDMARAHSHLSELLLWLMLAHAGVRRLLAASHQDNNNKSLSNLSSPLSLSLSFSLLLINKNETRAAIKSGGLLVNTTLFTNNSRLLPPGGAKVSERASD